MSSKSAPAEISISKKSYDGKDDAAPTVHLLPCKLQCSCEPSDFNGKKKCDHLARVQDYFDPVIRGAKGEELGTPGGGYTASFRGRPLQGTVLDIPEGYTGAHLQEKSPTDTDSYEQVCFQYINPVLEINYGYVALTIATLDMS